MSVPSGNEGTVQIYDETPTDAVVQNNQQTIVEINPHLISYGVCHCLFNYKKRKESVTMIISLRLYT